jgi:hypothetical protein
MRGQTIQSIMRELDPNLRFMLPMSSPNFYIISRACDIAGMERIRDTENAEIYAAYYDLEGFVSIGIAQDDASDADQAEWAHEQCARPILRSCDQVDILGMVIRDLTESDISDPTEDTP